MPITINGTGSITGISAGGLNDGIITQPELATGVAGTGPAFSAYLNSSISISAATTTKVTFDVEEFDTNNNFASSRFTPTVAGYYSLNTTCYLATTPSTIQILFYKNSNLFKYGTGTNTSTSGVNSSVLVYLNGSTDYVEVYIRIGATQILQPDISTTYFQGYLVRAA